MGIQEHLPAGRWARALTALVGYLLAVLLGAAVLTSIIGGFGGVSLSVGLAFLLLVPLAVVALPAREVTPGPKDHLPVLMRSTARKPRSDPAPRPGRALHDSLPANPSAPPQVGRRTSEDGGHHVFVETESEQGAGIVDA